MKPLTGKALMLECAYQAIQQEHLTGTEETIKEAIEHYGFIKGCSEEFPMTLTAPSVHGDTQIGHCLF